MKTGIYKRTIKDCRNCKFGVSIPSEPGILYCTKKNWNFDLTKKDPSVDCPFFQFRRIEE